MVRHLTILKKAKLHFNGELMFIHFIKKVYHISMYILYILNIYVTGFPELFNFFAVDCIPRNYTEILNTRKMMFNIIVKLLFPVFRVLIYFSHNLFWWVIFNYIPRQVHSLVLNIINFNIKISKQICPIFRKEYSLPTLLDVFYRKKTLRNVI